jgi:cyclohexa-1,5-dienecarbonyl-CoA hydratase
VIASIRTESAAGGRVERIVLARPKANVLDSAMIAAIRAHVATLTDRRDLALLVFDADGPNFSTGASVQEHFPEHVGDMLASFHAMFREVEQLGVPTAAIVRGNCLGGGCELALSRGWVFADPAARFGLPEVRLGVFPPLASALLPMRMGAFRAAQAIVAGGIVGAEEALRVGLVDDVSADPAARLQAFAEEALLPSSSVALRQAWRAARRPIRGALEQALPALERQYLDELMAHRDPVEGLRAFVERRPPRWEHT